MAALGLSDAYSIGAWKSGETVSLHTVALHLDFQSFQAIVSVLQGRESNSHARVNRGESGQ